MSADSRQRFWKFWIRLFVIPDPDFPISNEWAGHQSARGNARKAAKKICQPKKWRRQRRRTRRRPTNHRRWLRNVGAPHFSSCRFVCPHQTTCYRPHLQTRCNDYSTIYWTIHSTWKCDSSIAKCSSGMSGGYRPVHESKGGSDDTSVDAHAHFGSWEGRIFFHFHLGIFVFTFFEVTNCCHVKLRNFSKSVLSCMWQVRRHIDCHRGHSEIFFPNSNISNRGHLNEAADCVLQFRASIGLEHQLVIWLFENELEHGNLFWHHV